MLPNKCTGGKERGVGVVLEKKPSEDGEEGIPGGGWGWVGVLEGGEGVVEGGGGGEGWGQAFNDAEDEGCQLLGGVGTVGMVDGGDGDQTHGCVCNAHLSLIMSIFRLNGDAVSLEMMYWASLVVIVSFDGADGTLIVGQVAQRERADDCNDIVRFFGHNEASKQANVFTSDFFTTRSPARTLLNKTTPLLLFTFVLQRLSTSTHSANTINLPSTYHQPPWYLSPPPTQRS